MVSRRHPVPPSNPLPPAPFFPFVQAHCSIAYLKPGFDLPTSFFSFHSFRTGVTSPSHLFSHSCGFPFLSPLITFSPSSFSSPCLICMALHVQLWHRNAEMFSPPFRTLLPFIGLQVVYSFAFPGALLCSFFLFPFFFPCGFWRPGKPCSFPPPAFFFFLSFFHLFF